MTNETRAILDRIKKFDKSIKDLGVTAKKVEDDIRLPDDLQARLEEVMLDYERDEQARKASV